MSDPHPTLSQPWGDPDYDPSCPDCRDGKHGRLAAHDRPSGPRLGFVDSDPNRPIDRESAYDRPSGSGLREAAAAVLDLIDRAVDPKDDTTVLYELLAVDSQELVERLRRALSGSSDPEAMHDLYSAHEHQPGNCRFCDERRARLNPSGSSDPEAVGLDVDWWWATRWAAQYRSDGSGKQAASEMSARANELARRDPARLTAKPVGLDDRLTAALDSLDPDGSFWDYSPGTGGVLLTNRGLASALAARLNPSASDDGETVE
jgi:hypothetical protein